MRWQQESNHISGEITYTVTNGQSLSLRLHELGFFYDDVVNRWSLTVHRAETEQIKRIETFLAESERGGPRPRGDAPPHQAPRLSPSAPSVRRERSRIQRRRESDSRTNEITYSVLDKNLLRPGLKALGFLLDGATKHWSVTVRVDDAERICRIEAFLKESEQGPPREDAPQQGGQPPREDAPPERGRRRLTAPELALIDALLKETSWIYPGEVSFLKSIRRQVQTGGSLSARQLQVLQEMPGKVSRRKRPKFFQGGSPGLGKRR